MPDDQLSLAIGREGQNARLAARLTGWRIDIKSETEFATEEPRRASDEYEEETGGRCAGDPRSTAAAARTPRCRARASAACDRHQALEGTGTVYVAGEPLSDEEIADLADPDKA